MKYVAEINIMPLKELLDPQGKTITVNLPHIGIQGVEDIRVGKHITMTFESTDEQHAETLVKEACDKLLANKIMEYYTFTISKV